MTDLLLVDDAPMAEAVIFAEVVQLLPGVVDFDWSDAVQMPEPWLLHGESSLHAQVRLLSGRPDVTAWTAGAGKELAAILKEPATLHRTLLGLDEVVDGQPPTVAFEAIGEPPVVSAEGDGEPSLP